jgi:plastocyanin domain-containing protein
MDATQIGVTLGGVAAIAWVLWFFLLGQRKRTLATAGAGGVQEVKIRVKAGYEPDLIVVEKGRPVRLDFYRDETDSCSDTVVFGDFGIAKPLPAYRTTPVEFTPDRAGEFSFTCGMNMLRGRLVVEDRDEA